MDLNENNLKYRNKKKKGVYSRLEANPTYTTEKIMLSRKTRAWTIANYSSLIYNIKQPPKRPTTLQLEWEKRDLR